MPGAVRTAVIISAVDPYPPDSGKSVVIAGLLRHLRDRLGAEKVHYVHVGNAPVARPADFRGVVVHEVGGPRRTEQLKALVAGVGLRKWSLQEAFLSSATVEARVHHTLRTIDADLEIVDTVRMTQHVAGVRPRRRRVLYLDDLFSVRYRRMLDVIARGGQDSFDPLGQFSVNIPHVLRGLTRQPLTRRLLLTFESRRVARSERIAACDYGISLLLNDDEAAQLARETGADVRVIAPSIEQRPVPEVGWDGTPEFAFIGLLSMAHNHDGLTWFLDEGMPELLARRPDARLHVIGRGASEELRASIARYGDSVVLHGYVDDLDEAMMTRCALVNPLRFGSGVKIKTLDALARRVPVVATSFGSEGIVSSTCPGVRVVADAAEAGRVLAELADPAVREAEAAGAEALYASRFAPDVVSARYDEVFGTVPRSPLSVSPDGHEVDQLLYPPR